MHGNGMYKVYKNEKIVKPLENKLGNITNYIKFQALARLLVENCLKFAVKQLNPGPYVGV